MECVITAAARTPVGSFGGGMASLQATTLGTQLVRALLARAAIDPGTIDETILGQVLTAGCGQNPARQTAIHSGIPQGVPAMTINKVCGSGLKAVALAAQSIRAGDAHTVLAGGQESMSNAPHVLDGSRDGKRLGHWNLRDSMIVDGLWDAFNDFHMGETAERLADKYEISRAEQDAFAAESHAKAAAAWDSGAFDDETIAVEVPQRKGPPKTVERDEGIRADTTAEGLAKLRPAFRGEGSVTAGNASSLNDGAAALLVMSAERARSLGLETLVTIRAAGSAGVDPATMGIGPVPATQRCLERAGWTIKDLDLIEANEAFAAQALSVGRELQWDPARVNVNGGAIAIGHPIGASGARVLVTLIHALRRRGGGRGLATLCIGGGQGVALAVETP
ncbi:acetyl-CoA C-acetyltransferase [Algiphilus sp.]|uniref:acetyl-CoA C-acetyltransferase n=1 Tax=Algiphilus sp. TaxID=1872431 RepID=UPI002A5CBD49|nr:acetyl-CoA C-acetyltransferase [Pseudomonadota bacterium]